MIMIFTGLRMSRIFALKKSGLMKSDPIKNYSRKFLSCFHIQAAVIVVGLWHLVIHLLGIALFLSARFLMPNCSTSFYGTKKRSTTVLQDSLIFKNDFLSSGDSLSTNNTNNLTTWSNLSLLSFIATCFLIRGAMRGKSIFVLPFLLIQVFDILFDFFVIFTYVLLSSDIDEFFSQLQTPPFQRFIVRFGSDHRRLFMLIYIAISFSTKTYLMRIVYSYYKLLTDVRKSDNAHKCTPSVPDEMKPSIESNY